MQFQKMYNWSILAEDGFYWIWKAINILQSRFCPIQTRVFLILWTIAYHRNVVHAIGTNNTSILSELNVCLKCLHGMLRLFHSQSTCFSPVFRKSKYVARNRHQNTLRFTSAVQCHFWPFSWTKIDCCFYTLRTLSFADMFKVICGNRKGRLFQCCRSFPDYMSSTILITTWCVHCR